MWSNSGEKMKPIELTIDCEPTAKGRPRTAYRNGSVRTYTPEKTLIAQETIVAMLQPYKSQCFPEHIPVKLTCVFYRHKSKWLPKREKQPFRKPDLDNFLKLIMDSMNGLLVADDAQITTINMQKKWSPNGEGFITLRLEEDNE
jgi:Holliday junction resolvase RusA-like endonuclease